MPPGRKPQKAQKKAERKGKQAARLRKKNRVVTGPKPEDNIPVRASLPIEVDPEIMSGTPVFAGTRVPVASLFEYLMRGSNLDEFLECFPTVKKQAALLILDHFKREVLAEAAA